MASTVHDVVPFHGRFPSWEAFDAVRRAHCEKTFTMYVCRNTVKVGVANKRRKLQVPDSWVYDRKVYVCTHGYKRVSRSSGSRPRQNVRYTDCKARFTACVASELAEDGQEVLFIKVAGQHLIHTDHLVSLEQWRMYSQNRAAVVEHPYLAHEAELMRRVGSNKRTARAHIEKLSGKVCTMKDMHNLYARLNKREKSACTTETVPPKPPGVSQELGGSQSVTHLPCNVTVSARVEPVLQSFVDADVENHVSILSGDDGSNEAICLASRAMKEHFQVFPELMILDVSMATLANVQMGQQLHGFLSMDALGNAKPVFLARASAMSSSLLHRVCHDFKRTHPKWLQMKVLVMNKLLPDAIQVLTLEFPKTRLLLCQFHVLQLLGDLLVHRQLPARIQKVDHRSGMPTSTNLDQDKIIESLQQLVFAHSELRYNDVKTILTRQLTAGNRRELLVVFNRTWEPYRALWTTYARTEQIDLSCFFTKGMNSFWEPMKSALQYTSGINVEAASANTSHLHSATTGTSSSPFLSIPHQTADNSAARSTTSLPSNNSGVISISMAFRDGDMTQGLSGNSLAQCTSEVLATMKFIEQEWTSKMLLLELTKPVDVGRCDPLLHLVINCLSSFAVDLISSQLTIQSTRACGSVTVSKARSAKLHKLSIRSEAGERSVSLGPQAAEATVRWQNKTTREKRILQHDGSACDCELFALYQLPCRHLIWYEVIALQHKQLSLVAVSPRWFLRSFQTPRLASQRESNEIEYHLL